MTSPAGAPIISWAGEAQLPEAADFITGAIRPDDRYISHGEIQTGLSLDGATWAADLAEKMRKDFADLGTERRVVLAHIDGALVGVGVVFEHRDDRARYVITEDIAVAPSARSAGVGGHMMDFIEADARARGIDWAFLESGLDNEGAHAFFERRSYRPLSKVFGKRL